MLKNMSKKKMRGFTLIELIAVLVIMAILALIVTPLVMNIIRKARIAADKRSIDAYGRSIELAIAGYLLDTGKFPTSVGDLSIEYSGDEVLCSTTQLNDDSSVYLTGCTVKGRTVDYAYGEDKTPQEPASSTYDAYSVGDEVTYNNVDYYVIADSNENTSIVKLFKKIPLSVSEVNQYGEGHINRYTSDSQGTAYQSGMNSGGMAYYSSETCGYVNGNYVDTGCTTSYASSDIKYVVDAWALANAPAATEARLITRDEVTSLGYELKQTWDTCGMDWVKTDAVPTWLYSSTYWYWTMSPVEDSQTKVWNIPSDGNFDNFYSVYVAVYNSYGGGFAVRPVIVLDKSVLTSS